jgi:hypothetical protein
VTLGEVGNFQAFVGMETDAASVASSSGVSTERVALIEAAF